ncbi:carbohydrate binding domain-containing protein [Conexibacter sp. JD483]|uniref:carbohydrate binding domain-containing protein n=1 Tax=unclassified Conexibacter TaxID=2627773 RepID=UPI002720AE5C|nr:MULTISPECIES: carbohydrate binding domain-containing protein [unclassified Conexibacter]MDO8188325.1 carbohydrate binding domain-containing protein [Conexibacter sp. CPCC 205706]MDO8200727.1 carbohydrate binding domain-containing protein [Conexibacter sp. CPCC 205762]MDR9369451.1 carbohydrate binding domain-containing protein [Conexibacter sp. JD483]
MRRILLGLAVGAAVACALPATSSALDVDVTAAPYSAVGDGVTNDRGAIQRAIDAVNAAGGGKVTLPASRTFLTGNLRLKSNVELTIARGATLKQSQTVAHYDYTPLKGMIIDTTIPWNFTFYRNNPLVYAAYASNVKVTGGGTIQMTHLPDVADTVLNDAIGLFQVSGFELSGLHVIGGGVPYVGIYFSDNGAMRDMTLNEPYKDPVSGLELISSQHVIVENNVMRNPDGSPGATDDGIALGTIHNDPRSTGWWRSDVSEPLSDVIVRNNVVEAECCSALAFIPWASQTADKRDGEMRDIRIENNVLNAPSAWDSVKCWCDNPWNGPGGASYSAYESDQAQMTNIRFSGNSFGGGTSQFIRARIAGVRGVSFHPGNPYVQNPGFETTGTSSWTTTGTASQVGATDGLSVGQSGRFYGYIQDFGSGYTALGQGVGLQARTTYRYRARVQTSGANVRLYAHNQCTNETVGVTHASSTSWRIYDLTFTTTSACSNYEIGIDSSGLTGSGWARIDDVELHGPRIDDSDPRIAYAGNWLRFPDPSDFFGTHSSEQTANATANVTFFGTRAIWRGLKGPNMGYADVWLDGVFRGTVDLYTPGYGIDSSLWDTGTLASGWHVLGIRVQGAHNPLSAGNYVSIDSVAVSGY